MADSLLQLTYPDLAEIIDVEQGELCASAYDVGYAFRLSEDSDTEDGWQNGTAYEIKISLRYLNVGTDPLEIVYSADGATTETDTIVTKTDTGKWRWKHFVVPANVLLGTDYLTDPANQPYDFLIQCASELCISSVKIIRTVDDAESQWVASPLNANATHGDAVLDDTITAAKFTTSIQSDNFVAGVSGWKIWRASGNAEFNDIVSRGTIYATAGQIGGWDIGATTISSDSNKVVLDSAQKSLRLGLATDYDAGAGVFLGKNSGVYKFRIGATPSSGADSFYWDGTNLFDTGRKIGGTMAGWTVTSTQISSDSGNAVLNSATPKITLGAASAILTGKGVFIGKVSGVYQMRVGNPTDAYWLWDDTDFKIVNAGLEVYNGATQTGNIAKNGSAWFGASSSLKTIQWWTTGADAGDVKMGGSGAYALWDDSAAKFKIYGGRHKNTNYLGDPTDGELDTDLLIVYGHLQSNNWVSGVTGTGWKIGYGGNANFRNVTVRGSITASVFVKDSIEARAGTLIVAKSGGKLDVDMVVPAASTWTMTIDDPPDTGWLFDNGDIIQIKETQGSVSTTWYTVTRTTQASGRQNYTATYQSGVRPLTYEKGNVVVDFGASGQGWIELSADRANAPWISVRTHAGAPWTTVTERARLGRLNGITDATFGALTGYGLWTDNIYLTGSINATAGTISGVLSIGAAGGFYQGTGTFASPTTGLKISNSGGIGLLEMWGSGTKQVYANSSGQLVSAGGNIAQDSTGFNIAGTSALLKFYATPFATLRGSIGAFGSGGISISGVTTTASDVPTILLNSQTSAGKSAQLHVQATASGVGSSPFQWMALHGTDDFGVNVHVGSSATRPEADTIFQIEDLAPQMVIMDDSASALSVRLGLASNKFTLEELGGAANDLTVWDLANGRVGIGLASPNVPLEVAGKLRSSRPTLQTQYIGLDGGDAAGIYLNASSTAAAPKTLFINNFVSDGSAQAATKIVFQIDDSARLTIDNNGDLVLAEATDVIAGTSTGSKWGTASNQKMAWWGAAPVVQQADVGTNDGSLPSVATQANALRTLLRTIGLMA